MTGVIETCVDGEPASVEAAATYLRGTFAAEIGRSADTVVAARRTATGDWHGLAGEAFAQRMRTSAGKAGDLAAAVRGIADEMDVYATGLRSAQQRMQAVRDDALAAGLVVTGTAVHHPGGGPPPPGALPADADPATIQQHDRAQQIFSAHQLLLAAYENAATDAAEVNREFDFVLDAFVNMLNDLEQKWFLVVGDLVAGAGVAGVMAYNSEAMRQRAAHVRESSARFLDLGRSAPAGTSVAQVHRDADEAMRLRYAADDAARRADDLAARSGSFAFKAGGALAVTGIAYDVAVGGKPVDQAIVSGGVSFAASVGAGAAVGTLIPVPVVGTVAGALVGAGVGIFTSGMVDSLYENGIDGVGEAIGDGFEAVGGAGEAVGDVFSSLFD